MFTTAIFSRRPETACMRARSAILAGLAAVALCMGATMASAQDKPLIEKWLNGEVKANFPKVTYSGPPITLKFSSFLPPNSSLAKLHEHAFQRLSDATGGKLKAKAFWGNTLANAQRGAFEAIAGGLADFGQAYVGFNPGGFTTHLALAVPYIFAGSSDASWAAMELYPKYLKKEYEAKGVYLIRLDTTPPNEILTIREPVEKLEDMKGKKVWTPAGFPADLMKAFGATSAPLQVSEVYLAFQSGVIDAASTHDAGAKLFRLGELAKYRTETNLSVSNTENAINKAVFDGLPSDLKAIFYHWAQLWNEAEIELYYEREAADGRALMKKHNVKFISLSDAEMARWKAAARPAIDKFLTDLEAKGSPAREFVADLEKAAAKYRKMSGDEITKALLDKPIPGIIDMK